MAESEGSSQTKRCPRCETTKHKSEFSSMGYCRPCSNDYARERNKKTGGKASSPAPSTPTPAPPALTVREVADKVAQTPPRPVLIDLPSRQRVIARELADPLLGLLQTGEQLTIIATRTGLAILIDEISIKNVPI